MTIIVTTPNSVIEDNIKKCMAEYTKKLIQTSIPKIEKELKFEVASMLRSSRTYYELLIGDLRKDFGIPAGEESARVNAIIETISNNIIIRYINNFYGGIQVGILREGFKDILSMPEAVINTAKQTLPWLEWLLLHGDTIIVSDFSVVFGSFPYSRSGDAIMIRDIGGFWRVQAGFSGTAGDNWLTRTLSTIDTVMADIMAKYIK